MNLTALTTALHKWADKHGGQFPDAMLCNEAQRALWTKEAEDRFAIRTDFDMTGGLREFKGVTILDLLSSDDPRILFALEPSA